MQFDVRTPIGALFAALGILLTAVGLINDKNIYEKSLGININLKWGLVMLAFGLLMITLGRRQARSSRNKTKPMDQEQ